MNTRTLRRVAVLGVVGAIASVSVVAGTAQAAPAPSRTVLSTTTPSVVPGQGVKLKAVVKPVTGSAVPTGSVTFNEGATVLGTVPLTLVNNVAVAKLTVKLTGFGDHSITATYSGSTALATSTSLVLIANVSKAATTTTVTSTAGATAGTVKFKAAVKLVAPSTGLATGTITFVVDGGAPQIIALNSFGTAALTVAFVPGTIHNVTATYSGSTAANASNGSLTVTA
jgi:hypothetical protein